MNMHDADLSKRLTDFLSRRAAPRNIAGNEKAQTDQISAYLGILRRRAPKGDMLHEWWGNFLEALSEVSETWAWPSEKEVWNACKSASGHNRPTASADTWRPDPVAINLGRLERNEPMGEDWLWGQGALRLVAAGADRGALRDRRIRMAQHMASVWGQDDARAKLLELKAKHEAAERAVNDFRRHPRDMPEISLNRAFSDSQIAELVA